MSLVYILLSALSSAHLTFEDTPFFETSFSSESQSFTSQLKPCSSLPSISNEKKPFLHCPGCDTRCRRSQDVKRHLLSHLPSSFACSFDSCTWRGVRHDAFKRHSWLQHRSYMTNGFQIYDSHPLVDGIIKGTISFGDAEQQAIECV